MTSRASGALGSSLVIAAGIVVAGALAGLVVGAGLRLAGSQPGASPTAIAAVAGASVDMSWRPTSSPRQSPAPTEVVTPAPTSSATLVIPTPGPPGPDGIAPPLPPLVIDGADPTVVQALRDAAEAIDGLSSFRYRGGTSGRTLMDLSTGGLNFGMEATATQRDIAAIDALVAFQMVEFDGAAGITTTERYVLIGEKGWRVTQTQVERIDDLTTVRLFVDLLLPTGIAERTLLPFAGGWERVGSDPHHGVPATRYRATPAGIDAYTAVTGVRGDWTADLWIADAGYLLAMRIHGETRDGSDGFLAEIELTSVNDPVNTVRKPAS